MRYYMHRNDFKPLSKYLQQLKDENVTPEDRKVYRETVRGKEFFSLMPVLLQKYPDIEIRDFLEVDRTFAILFPASKRFTLIEATNIYLDLQEFLEATTYMKTKNTGLIEYPILETEEAKTGYWMLLK